jgi:hypothetical protein
MNPDPVAKLARFTPASGPDAAELVFAAGRASARTHWGWKAAVAALVASNLALGAVIAFRAPAEPPAHPEPVGQPQPEQPVSTPPTSAPVPGEEPWSYRALRSADPERVPETEPITSAAPRQPLTVLSGHRGELD